MFDLEKAMAVWEIPWVTHRLVNVGGVNVFYREAGPRDAPTLLLLHGFPSASHQFRRLMDALGGSHHLVAPDYPGFGHTETPDAFTYSFDRLADVMKSFVRKLNLNPFVMYVFDLGAPIGFRLAERHPEWVAGLLVQNGNAYEEGLSELVRGFIANRPSVPDAAENVHKILAQTLLEVPPLAGVNRMVFT